MCCDHIHEPIIILEAIASYNLCLWHAVFGLPGSHNDINVLKIILFLENLLKDVFPRSTTKSMKMTLHNEILACLWYIFFIVDICQNNSCFVWKLKRRNPYF